MSGREGCVWQRACMGDMWQGACVAGEMATAAGDADADANVGSPKQRYH